MIIRFIHLDRIHIPNTFRFRCSRNKVSSHGGKHLTQPRSHFYTPNGRSRQSSSFETRSHLILFVSPYCTTKTKVNNENKSNPESPPPILDHNVNKINITHTVDSDKPKQSDPNKPLNQIELEHIDEPVIIPKKPLTQKVKEALIHMWHHYRDGGKLLAFNVRCCAIVLKRNLLNGEKMNRRERRLLLRTFSDLFRLIPLTAFVVIPFAELALPFFLILFPNMLPSTFADKEQKKKSINKILVETESIGSIMREALSRKAKKMDDPELINFVKKIKSGGANISLQDIYQYAKVFEEDLTVEGLERKQAQAMCRLVGVQPFGPDAILRRRLSSKLDEIKKDDLLIVEEGIDSLDEEELEEACRIRGIYWKAATSVMKRRLKDWLKLSVEQNVPISLLIYSRTLVFPNERLEIALTKSFANIPVELVEDIEILNEPLEIEQLEKEILEEEEKINEEEQEAALERKKDIENLLNEKNESEKAKVEIKDKGEEASK